MASCLGLYVEDNIIKYAKVSKSNETIKVESFGIKFYEDLKTAVKQIVEETYSFKIPISINMTGEVYDKFEVFSLLSPNDMEGVIKTEFENICYDREINPNAFEQRHIVANTNGQSEKVKIIHISASKAAVEERKKQFSEYRINNIVPIGISIKNLLKKEKKTASLIVNIEKNTTITKVYDNLVSDVVILPYGAHGIIDNIGQIENSRAKAYEICKNTTIYTDSSAQYEDNEYLPEIMQVLYQIATEVRRVTEESTDRIEKVYITGIASVVNNIDVYFQDYLKNITCEVLKPSFIGNNSKVNIKDYIEVNSAISLALETLEKSTTVNFNSEPTWKKFSKALKSDVSRKKGNIKKDDITNMFGNFNRQYYVALYSLILIAIFYLITSFIITNQLDNKIELANLSIQSTNNRIGRIKEYNTEFNDQINEYKRLITNIENINNWNSENKRYRNTIPNLLNNIMVVIPKNVQLTSIENTSGSHIVMYATSNRYEQIAFFKTKLKTEGILKNVVSDTGTMQSGYLSVKIEGELP